MLLTMMQGCTGSSRNRSENAPAEQHPKGGSGRSDSARPSCWHVVPGRRRACGRHQMAAAEGRSLLPEWGQARRASPCFWKLPSRLAPPARQSMPAFAHHEVGWTAGNPLWGVWMRVEGVASTKGRGGVCAWRHRYVYGFLPTRVKGRHCVGVQPNRPDFRIRHLFRGCPLRGFLCPVTSRVSPLPSPVLRLSPPPSRCPPLQPAMATALRPRTKAAPPSSWARSSTTAPDGMTVATGA